MTIMEWIVFGLYIITDALFACFFFYILGKICGIKRKKTFSEKFALIGTGWMFALYLVNIIVMVQMKL